MSDRPTIRKPQRRECERCGRQEVWSDDSETWRIAVNGEAEAVGDPYCIHEWDINGAFLPYE